MSADSIRYDMAEYVMREIVSGLERIAHPVVAYDADHRLMTLSVANAGRAEAEALLTKLRELFPGLK